MDHELRKAGASARLHLPRSAQIEAYGNNGFRFDEMSHRGSLLCLPDAIWAWDVTDPKAIDTTSLTRIFENSRQIDTLLIGSGMNVWIAPAPLRDELRKANIVLDVMQTGPAVRIYNVMISERRRVAAALIAVP
jgi:uncharacterized protein